MQIKRWESPRRRGRNDKGKGGSARKRQLKKRQQMLRQKLKANSQKKQNHQIGERAKTLSFLFCFFEVG